MSSIRKLILVIALSVFGFSMLGIMARHLNAMTALPLDMDQMSEQAGKIFVGRCLDLSQELDEHGFPVTYVRFEILDAVKGVQKGETLRIKMYGTQKAPLHVREGEQAVIPLRSLSKAGMSYEPGRDYLLFLYPESAWGFTSPVGGGQGAFVLETAANGTRFVMDPLSSAPGLKLMKKASQKVPLKSFLKSGKGVHEN